MKKFALVSLLSLISIAAMATEIKLEYQDANGRNGSADKVVYELAVKEAINRSFAADIQVKQSVTDGTNALSTRLETGITGSTPLMPAITGFTRVALGQKFTNTTDYSYYSIEPGTIVALGHGVSTSLSYRLQDAFSNGRADLSRTWRTKLGYDINNANNVFIGYDVSRGDTGNDANVARIGYVYKF